MNSDWPQIKARLQSHTKSFRAMPQNLDSRACRELAADIRAALQRVETLQKALDEKWGQEVAGAIVANENLALRQRVEELEQELEENNLTAISHWRRAEAAERRVEELEEMGRAWRESDEHKNANALRQRVEELERAAVRMVVSAQEDLNPWIRRAEAAEAKLVICESTSAFRHEEIKRYQAKLARVVEVLSDFTWDETGTPNCWPNRDRIEEQLAAAKEE